MEAKHTPGPWVKEGFRIDNGYGFTVAVCPNTSRAENSETTHADARLIAAAPELLKELEWALSVIKGEQDRIGFVSGSPIHKRLKAGQAVIRKATE